ncbi:MAG: DUF4142 domain-containing protein [Verrucomicrobiota bacterium]|nr:DUF4142 domain-containing protein [Verrucomicrobiota bacterium]
MKLRSALISHLALGLTGLALAATASAQNPWHYGPRPSKDSAVLDPYAKPGALTSQDRQFAMDAARGGIMEVEMGRMAEQQGKSAEVKRIGGRLVADHSQANAELAAIARRKGIKLPTEPAKMAKLRGADFDRQYLALMAEDHRKDLADFQSEAQNGRDPDLRAFAAKTSRVIKNHLQMVEAARKTRG